MSSYKEIARLSGVSIGTVYRVLHERGRYSPETARRVRRIATELGYKKNIYASNLSRSRDYRIAIVMPDPAHDNRYWEQPHTGMVEAIAALEQYRVSRVDYFYDEHDQSSFSERLAAAVAASPDAMIIAPSLGPERERELSDTGLAIPHVFVDSLIPTRGRLGSVGQDSYASGRAGGRLVDLLVPEPRPIALVRSMPASRHIEERIGGARDALLERRSRPVKEIDVDFADPPAASERLARQIESDAPGGYFVSNSNASILSNLLSKLGARAAAIVGYDLVPENVNALRNGRLAFLLSQRPFEQG
ncbi:MAG TPA: LacI family DNA-binding transcriptional regulator, partial [Spirochaetia bacterium]|nr:LacI family DNA-binding transcriptional regulator [Spirochaetia bacterium]